MSEFQKFGEQLREVLIGLLALGEAEGVTKGIGFEDNFFYGDVNQFISSGAEILVKRDNRKGQATRVDVGDRFIGIGITHTVETLSRPAGPDTIRALGPGSGASKGALRAFEIANKTKVSDGFEFGLRPLSPADYSELVEKVSGGSVKIPVQSIPEGTMILSFLLPDPTYTLKTIPGSPGANWESAVRGTRHWNVGIGKTDDFWAAKLPSDDIGTIAQVPSSMTIGAISFGLSLLAGSKTSANFRPVPCLSPSGESTQHQFCLSGRVVGTQDGRRHFRSACVRE